MIEATSTIAASLVVATFAAFVPSAVLAQARPNPQGDGSLPGDDATTETTLSGTLEKHERRSLSMAMVVRDASSPRARPAVSDQPPLEDRYPPRADPSRPNRLS